MILNNKNLNVYNIKTCSENYLVIYKSIYKQIINLN